MPGYPCCCSSPCGSCSGTLGDRTIRIAGVTGAEAAYWNGDHVLSPYEPCRAELVDGSYWVDLAFGFDFMPDEGYGVRITIGSDGQRAEWRDSFDASKPPCSLDGSIPLVDWVNADFSAATLEIL